MIPETEILRELDVLNTNSPKGFALAFHIRMTTPSYLFQNYSTEWSKYYSENGLVMADPTVLWGFENDGTISWSKLKKLDSNNMLPKAAEYGLAYGVTWARGTGDSRSIGSFARDDREFEESEVNLLVQSANKIHDITVSLQPLTSQALATIQDHGYVASQSVVT